MRGMKTMAVIGILALVMLAIRTPNLVTDITKFVHDIADAI